jgi:hypothetical protein
MSTSGSCRFGAPSKLCSARFRCSIQRFRKEPACGIGKSAEIMMQLGMAVYFFSPTFPRYNVQEISQTSHVGLKIGYPHSSPWFWHTISLGYTVCPRAFPEVRPHGEHSEWSHGEGTVSWGRGWGLPLLFFGSQWYITRWVARLVMVSSMVSNCHFLPDGLGYYAMVSN